MTVFRGDMLEGRRRGDTTKIVNQHPNFMWFFLPAEHSNYSFKPLPSDC